MSRLGERLREPWECRDDPRLNPPDPGPDDADLIEQAWGKGTPTCPKCGNSEYDRMEVIDNGGHGYTVLCLNPDPASQDEACGESVCDCMCQCRECRE
jgi:hypothetical protein